MGSILSLVRASPGILRSLAGGPLLIFWIFFTPLRYAVEVFLYAVGWLIFVIRTFLGLVFGLFFTARTGLSAIQGGLQSLNDKLARTFRDGLTEGLAKDGLTAYPWVLFAGVLHLIRRVGTWIFMLTGALWNSLMATFFFAFAMLLMFLFAYPLLQLETSPETAFNLANVMWEAVSSVYNLFAGTFNFYVDLITPLKPYLDLGVAWAWQFVFILAEGVLGTVFGSGDVFTRIFNNIGQDFSNVRTAQFFGNRGLSSPPPVLLPYHSAVETGMEVSLPPQRGRRELIDLITFGGEAGLPPLQALTTGMKGWEALWIPIFTTIFTWLDLLGSVSLIVWELTVKIFFPILNELAPFLFDALEGAGCCFAAPFCCVRQLVEPIILFFVDALNIVLGGFAGLFTGEIVEVIPRDSVRIACTDNEIPGGYICECSDFYDRISSCQDPQRDCVPIGTNSAGLTVWAETEVRYPDQAEPVIISESTDKQQACPNTEATAGSRTLSEMRRRRLSSAPPKECHELRRLPVCVRARKRDWLVQVADCSADRLIFLGRCDGSPQQKGDLHELQRFMKSRRGRNVKVTPLVQPKQPSTSSSTSSKQYAVPENDPCAVSDEEETTTQTVKRLVCYATTRVRETQFSVENSWAIQRARHILNRKEEEEEEEKPAEGIQFPEVSRTGPDHEGQNVFWHHASRTLKQLKHTARTWRRTGQGRPDHAIDALHTALVNAHVRYMHGRGLTTRVGVHKGILTHMGERLGKFTFKMFRERLSRGSLVKGRRKLQSGVNPNIDVGVFSEQLGGVCEYTCPDGSCIELERSSECPYPSEWYAGTYLRYAGYAAREAAVNADYRVLLDGVWNCWRTYELKPDTYPVRASVYMQLFQANLHDDAVLKAQVEAPLVYCWPLRPNLPKLPKMTQNFILWAQEQCGVTVGSQGESIRGCTCPQYWDSGSVGNYNGYWMAGSPVYFRARLLTTLHMYRYLITYSMASVQGKLAANGQLSDPNNDTGGFWWTFSSMFWPTAPDWFRQMFSYQEASGGMTFNQNAFCVTLAQGSHIFIILFFYYPLYIFLTYFWAPVFRIILDILGVGVYLLDMWFNFLTLQSIKYGGATLEQWQQERAVQLTGWAVWAKQRGLDTFAGGQLEKVLRRGKGFFFGSSEVPIMDMSTAEISQRQYKLKGLGLPPLTQEEIRAENVKRREELARVQEERRKSRLKTGQVTPENESLEELTMAEIQKLNEERTKKGLVGEVSHGEILVINRRRRKLLEQENKRRLQRGVKDRFLSSFGKTAVPRKRLWTNKEVKEGLFGKKTVEEMQGLEQPLMETLVGRTTSRKTE